MNDEIRLFPKNIIGDNSTEPYELNGQLIQNYRFETDDGQRYCVVVPYGYLTVHDLKAA